MQLQLDFSVLVSMATSILAVTMAAIAFYTSRKDRKSDEDKEIEDAEKAANKEEHDRLQEQIRDVGHEMKEFNRTVDNKIVAFDKAMDGKIKEFADKVDENLSEMYKNQREIKENYLTRFERQAQLTNAFRDQVVERVHQLELKTIERFDELKNMLMTNHKA